jgi:hypothetical protein
MGLRNAPLEEIYITFLKPVAFLRQIIRLVSIFVYYLHDSFSVSSSF